MGEHRWPRVSVVVPSLGRPELTAAVGSVLAQDYPGEVETVVVIDGDSRTAADLPQLDAIGVRVLTTGGRRGAGAARNLGVQAATGDLVALLDDDDTWEVAKLSTQVRSRAGLSDAERVVTSCRVRWRRPGHAARSRPVPDVLPPPGTRVEDYLFRRRRPTLGRAVLPTPTLLMTRRLALAVPWDEQLTRHQDWDWVVRAQDDAGARFAMCPEPLVVCATGSAGSISAGADWSTSARWCLSRGSSWSPATRVDFLVAQPLRYALQGRSARGTATVLSMVARTRRPPSWQAALVGGSGLLSRRAFETAALISGRSS